jgi:hypothetical protein
MDPMEHKEHLVQKHNLINRKDELLRNLSMVYNS